MRAKQVDVQGRGGGVTTSTGGHRMHHDGCFSHSQTGTTQGLRHGDTQPASLGHRLVEFLRKSRSFLTLAPILVAEIGADLAHTIIDVSMQLSQIEVHRGPVDADQRCLVCRIIQEHTVCTNTFFVNIRSSSTCRPLLSPRYWGH
ncbi:hypothetical protein D9M69_619490 [compost metagenome]